MGGALIYLKKIDGNNVNDDPWLTHTSLPLKNEWRRLSWPAMKKIKNIVWSRWGSCIVHAFLGFPLYPFIAVNLFQKSSFTSKANVLPFLCVATCFNHITTYLIFLTSLISNIFLIFFLLYYFIVKLNIRK